MDDNKDHTNNNNHNDNNMPADTIPLYRAAAEARVTIDSLDLGENGLLRLSSMGLFPGARIRVIDNSRPDTSIVECRGTRLALGRGLAHRIFVR